MLSFTPTQGILEETVLEGKRRAEAGENYRRKKEFS